MSTFSAIEVTSPLMSTMLALSLTVRTFIVTSVCATVCLLLSSRSPARLRGSALCGRLRVRCRRAGQGACFVREHAHEVGQARDVENLDVMTAQAVDQQAAPNLACLCQQADDEGDAGRIHELHVAEIEQNGAGAAATRVRIGRVERVFAGRIELAMQVDDGDPGPEAHARLKRFHGHAHLLPDTRSSQWYAASRHRRCASRRPGS